MVDNTLIGNGTETRLNMGKIYYVQPNNFDSKGFSCGPDTAIVHPYENYGIIVDLIVEKISRYSCAQKNGEIYYHDDSKEYMHFIGGGGKYLTTDYTELSFGHLQNGGNQECLGVESIHIQYESWFMPQVTIKFTDVRGAALMLPQEAGLYDTLKKEKAEYNGNITEWMENGNKGAKPDYKASTSIEGGSFFKSLFTFPAPIFYLRVKGFYGDAVTYKLALSNISLEFDSSTGNFNINATFIGYMYGILADIPLVYCAIAPRMEVGQKYWENQKTAGSFQYYINGESGDTLDKSEQMKTFSEFRMACGNLHGDVLESLKNDNALSLYKERSIKIGLLKNCIKYFPFRTTKNGTWKYSDAGSCYYTIIKEKESTRIEANAISDEDALLNALFSIVNEQAETSRENVKDLLKNDEEESAYKSIEEYKKCSTYKTIENLAPSYTWDCKNGEIIDGLDESSILSKKSFIKQAYSVMKESCKNTKYTGKIYYYEVKSRRGNIWETWHTELDALETANQETAHAIDDKKSKLVIDTLGFEPTIKNMFHMTHCHMETFLYCFNECLKEVMRDMEEGKRTISGYILNREDSDLGYNETGETQMPPFPLFTSEIWDKGDKKRVTLWPSDYNSKLSDMPEVKFVERLLAAAGQLAKEEYVVENAKSMESETSEGSVTNGIAYYPTTIYDVVWEGNGSKNPYNQIKNDLRATTNQQEWVNRVLTTFIYRLVYFLQTNKMNGSDLIKEFACVEAENVNLALGSGSFTYFFRKAIEEYFNNETKCNELGESIYTQTDFGSILNGHHNEKLFDNEKFNWIYKVNSGKKNIVLPIGNFAESSIVHYLQDSNIEGDTGNTLEFLNYSHPYDNSDSFRIIDFDKYKSLHSTTHTRIDDESTFSTEKLFYCYNGDDLRKAQAEAEKDVQENLSLLNNSGNALIFNSVQITANNYYNTISANEYKNPAFNFFSKNPSILTLSLGTFDYSNYSINPDFAVQRWGINVNEKCNIFLSSAMYLQKDWLSKAYVFIMSLSYCEYDGSFFKTCGSSDDNAKNGYRTYSDILLEGAFWWRYNYMSNNLDTEGNEIDPISYLDGTKNTASKLELMIENGSVGFCLSSNNFRKYVETGSKKRNVSRSIKTMEVFGEFAKTVFKDIFESFSPKVYVLQTDAVTTDTYLSETELTFDVMKGDTSASKCNFIGNIFGNGTCQRGMYIRNNNSKISTFKAGGVTYPYYSNVNYPTDINLFSENASNGVKTLRDKLLTKVYFCVDLIHTLNGDGSVIKNEGITSSEISEGTSMFMKALCKYFYTNTEQNAESNGNSVTNTDPFTAIENRLSTTDVKLSTYLSLKNLYDKWLCGTDFDRDWRVGPGHDKSVFSKFMYIDSYYRQIGTKFYVNIGKFGDSIGKYTHSSENHVNDSSVYQFLADVASTNGCLFMAVPFMFGLDAGGNGENGLKNSITTMFDAKTWRETKSGDDWSSFVTIYTYKPSSNVGDIDDGFDLGGTLDDAMITNVPPAFLDDSSDSIIPAFGVDYGAQNQAYFQNITLNTTNPTQSEYTIRSTINIANHAGEGPQEVESYGQDIYRVFSNYAYTCSVTMLGDVMISPLMYFQLNNVPMWKGAYIITSVEHSISPGNMTTTFTGYRLCKYAYKLVDGDILADLDLDGKYGTNNSTTDGNEPAPQPSDLSEGESFTNKEVGWAYDTLFYRASGTYNTTDKANKSSYDGQIAGQCGKYTALFMKLLSAEYNGDTDSKDTVNKGLTGGKWTNGVPNGGLGNAYLSASNDENLKYATLAMKIKGRYQIAGDSHSTGSVTFNYIKNFINSSGECAGAGLESVIKPGDAIVYWSDSRTGYDSSRGFGHAQFYYPGHQEPNPVPYNYGGKSDVNYNWSTSCRTNYGAKFVYGSSGGKCSKWHYDIIRIKKTNGNGV